MEYLKLPLNFEPFFEKNAIPTCNVEGSIMRFLHLLITTVQDEYTVDRNFGLAFWDDDFSTHIHNDFKKDQLLHHLKAQIVQYEPRLTDVQVQVKIKTELMQHVAIQTERRRVEIIIQGKLTHSHAPFQFQTAFFIGPLDLD